MSQSDEVEPMHLTEMGKSRQGEETSLIGVGSTDLVFCSDMLSFNPTKVDKYEGRGEVSSGHKTLGIISIETISKLQG